jgi:poly(3-hydroxybutyrate) depolymerase
MRRFIQTFLVLWAASGTLRAPDGAAAQDDGGEPVREITVREALVLPDDRPRDRRSILRDELEWRWVHAQWPTPREAESVVLRDGGSRTWQRVAAGDDGWLADRVLAGGTCVANVDAPADRVWLLDVRGCSAVRVNDAPRVADVYDNGLVAVPVALRQGPNELVFLGGRGRLRAQLELPDKPLFLSTRDTTFPTVVRGEAEVLWGALLVVNATLETVEGLALQTRGAVGQPLSTAVPALPPLSVRKAAFRVQPPADLAAESISFEVLLTHTADSAATLDCAALTWPVCDPAQRHRRTFRSDIDGSVQYYAVTPPLPDPARTEPPGLCLTLHGAGVEAEGQAAVYAPKPDLFVVAPTNRRAFGFDWEDWGRWDALEVLDEARQRFGCDAARTYLTGHSMGGHGTWHLGSLLPDQFAAIGPSAGWVSFATYAGGYGPADDQPVAALLARARGASDTLARVDNLGRVGVYVLHGDRDDNVPVEQARLMRERLGSFHTDFAYREQPGAGHWWGNACCDWPPLFDFFADRRRPADSDVSRVVFATPNPAVAARCSWVTIALQQQHGAMSRVELAWDREARRVHGRTENVQQLALEVAAARSGEGEVGALNVELDGGTPLSARPAQDGLVWLNRTGDQWETMTPPSAAMKGPHRYGPFKEAFQNRFLLVYGTQGSAAENDWMLAKARFDAETFWYRGNGSVDVLRDTDFRADEDVDRGVIVYGNEDVNSAWRELLSDGPVRVARSGLSLGDETIPDPSLLCLFVRPRPGSDRALVAAIGGTDLAAMRATTRLPVFVSGTAYPDVLIASPDYLLSGLAAVRRVGYFGTDWSVASGQWEPRAGTP